MTARIASVDCTHVAGGLMRHTRALKIALAITVVFMVAEAVGGWLSRSLALMADAGHMLGDAASIAFALFVAWIAQRPATPQKTYGYLRLEILAALINGVVLVVIAGLVIWQAVRRFSQPAEIATGLMLGVAAVGLIANVVAMRVLHAGHTDSLNVRGAYLHVLGDLLGSIGTLVAGGIIYFTGWTVADPLASIFISVLVGVSAWRLLSESVDVLLEGSPRHISLHDVERQVSTIPGISEVHDLHVWTVTSGVVAMTGHAVIDDPQRSQPVLELLENRMSALGICHVTMQLESHLMCGEVNA